MKSAAALTLWMLTGVVFFVPLAIALVFERRADQSSAPLFVVLVLGAAVGAGMRFRKRIGGLPGKLFRLSLYALMSIAALAWITFGVMGVESYQTEMRYRPRGH